MALLSIGVGGGAALLSDAVDAAPKVVAPKERLDLSGYEIVFADEFDGPLDVSAWGPGTRWIAHTPWRGDFGDARFSDPREGFPFTVQDGVLRIEAHKSLKPKKKGPEWWSGLLASAAPDGSGFSLQYGYFEMSGKLPAGVGVWPAFWLMTTRLNDDPKTVADGSIEVDILEYYGRPDDYMANLHVWKPPPHRSGARSIRIPRDSASSGFHTYGALVTPEWVVFYHDRVEVMRRPTPPEHKRPLMLLVNLALGGGWPIDDVQSPTFMYVDYVRAYAPIKQPKRRPAEKREAK